MGLSSIGGSAWAMALVGAPIAGAFLIPFFPLAFLEDSARVRVTPLSD